MKELTNRQRFHMVMNRDPGVDRFPALEWASWWDKTLAGWQQEGLSPGLDGEELFRHFGLDLNTQFWFDHRLPACPKEAFHGSGIMADEADYERLKPLLYPRDAVERMMERIRRTVPLQETGEAIVWYTLEGFFWFPRTLFGIEGHMYAFYDYPELYHRICRDLLEWQLEVVDRLADSIQADFMTIAEDMSYNNGPMLSKEFFDEFIQPYYRQLIPRIRSHGTRVFIDSDGDVSQAISWFREAGVEGILPLERQAGVDVGQLQQDYPGFLLLGGFDKMVMLRGREAIRGEFERLAPAIRAGGFLPSMDHQTPPGTPLEDYRYYVQLLREYGALACKDA